MAATTGQLGLVTPTQGTLSGTWGDTVNYGITEYVNIAIAGTLSFAGDGAITLANTTGNASATNFNSTTAQYMVIRITGTQTVTKVITGPSYSKLYMVDHAGATSAVTFKASGQTGVSVAVGEKCFVYYNGTDYVKVASSVADGVTSVGGTGTVNGITLTGTVTSTGNLTLGGTLSGVNLTSQVTGTLPVANGGTGVTTSTGSGNSVLSTSPTLVTPILGTPQSVTLTNATGLPLTTGVTGLLPVANGGTGTATPSLAAGSNVTVTGTWPNQTISANAANTGQYQAVASGTLANGSLVVVNANGTVSAVNSNNQSAGTAATFVASTSVSDVCATYDVTNNKVVVAYVEGSAPNPIYAVVGTVSGTSISFGTPVLVVNNSAYPSITYDTAQSKVVIAYANASTNVGAAVVGTVSGTSISFGTAVSFVSGSYPTFVNAAYEATQSRVVIAYTDQANSAYGTAIVGSVSGTAISFGTSVVIVAANVLTYFSVTAVGSSKVVISYRNNSSSSVGTAVVGTVTSTSISFGTPVVFNNAATIYIVSAYDTTNSKVVVAYSDTGNSDYGTAIVGTVSGTSISFGSEIVFESAFVSNLGITYSSFANRIVISWRITGTGYATTITGLVSGTTISFGSSTAANAVSSVFPTVAYDSTAQKVVLAYRNSTASSGQSQVLTVGTNNLTATNYIGISSAAYANGATAIIQTVGSTDDAQTSLTPGLAYYVQTDGTLASTAGSPSVFAGTAVAATKILVKG